MRNEAIGLILKKFVDNETKQFTIDEFMTAFFETDSGDSSPLYLENKAYAFLRYLKFVKCVKLVAVGTNKIYEFNLIQAKKVFPDVFKEIKFYKEKGAKK